jgi:predicted nucleic acid-binding protein
MIVVVTNILAYRWLPGPRTAEIGALIRHDPEWAAPLLWRSEFRNVLAGYIRAGKLSPADAKRATRHAAGCFLGGEHALSDHAVLDLVARTKCTAYDCEFAALAISLGTILVTEDKALLTALPKVCRALSEAIKGS